MKKSLSLVSIKKDKFIYVGSLSFSFAAILVLLSKESLSVSQTFSIVFLEICIPSLVVVLMALFIEETDGRIIIEKLPWWYILIGPLGSFLGFGALFFHYGLGFGFLFLASVSLGFHYLGRFNWVEEITTYNDKDT